jgi:hypothetical protein
MLLEFHEKLGMKTTVSARQSSHPIYQAIGNRSFGLAHLFFD